MKRDPRLVWCALSALLMASPVLAQEGISQQEAEQFAAGVFSSDIRAGKLTRQQAGAFFKCGNDRYAKKLDPQTAMALTDATVALSTGKPSEAEKQKYEQIYKKAEKLQQEAENGCRKELGIDPSVKRLFGDLGR